MTSSTGHGHRLGFLLRGYRSAAGLTQEELANRAGLSVRALSDIERGRTARPFPSSVRLLADALALAGPARAELMDALRAVRAGPGESDIPASGGGHGAGQLPAVPRQLPAPVRQFAGRAAELGSLNGLLSSSLDNGPVVISVISGAPGTGKTTLAVHWAHQVADRFPDGQLYVDLRGFDPSATPVPPADAIRGFLDALGVPAEQIPPSTEVREGLYRSLLAGRQMMIVLDNARDAAQVAPLLPGGAGCLVVVTSRSQLAGLIAGQGAYPVTLDVFTEDDAREFLTRRLRSERIAGDLKQISELTRLCGRLPLALAIVAARAALRPGLPLAAVVAELREADGRLDALDGGDPVSSVRAVFSWSYRNLSDPAARMFRLLGLHPGPDISVLAAASLAGVPERLARRALTELTAAHLATQSGTGRFALHDLLRSYASEQARARDQEADRRAAITRALDHYLHTASVGMLLLDPGSAPVSPVPPEPAARAEEFADYGRALAWFDAEHKVLVAISLQAAGCGFDTHAVQLPRALAAFLRRRGHWQDWTATQLAALAAAQRLGDLAGQAEAHHSLGWAYLELGRYYDAHAQLRQAVELAQRIGDDAIQAASCMIISAVLEAQGRSGDGLDQARRALELFRAAGDRFGEARALNAVGWDYAKLGEPERGLSFCQPALGLCRELGVPMLEAATADSLGFAHHQLGRYHEAADWYAHASDLYQTLGDRYRQGITLARKADAQQAANDEQGARRNWQQALAILDGLHHPDAAAVHAKLYPGAGLQSMPA